MKTHIEYSAAEILNKQEENINTDVFFACAENVCSSMLDELACLPSAVCSAKLSVVFFTSSDMADTNNHYRNINEPTDVLSFPLWENEDGIFSPPENWDVLPLGDIIVCPEVVGANAKSCSKDFMEELALVIFHGFLHLTGYDHDTEEKKNIMWELQNKMVRNFMKDIKNG